MGHSSTAINPDFHNITMTKWTPTCATLCFPEGDFPNSSGLRATRATLGTRILTRVQP